MPSSVLDLTSMKSGLNSLVRLAVLVAAGVLSSCCQASEDPTTYFGGTNNLAYLDWINSADFIAQQYRAALFFSPTKSDDVGEDEGLALHWNIVRNDEDDRKSYLQIAVAVRAMGGFVGFGLADAGGMQGADIMLYESENTFSVRDAHVLQERLPITDECQDWELVGDPVQEDGFLMVQARRLLDTGDNQDKAIIPDDDLSKPATRIIGSWGNTTTTASYHGPRRIRSAMRFHNLPSGDETETLNEAELFQQKMEAEADGYFELRNINHTISPVETEYVKFCLTWQDMLDQGVPDGVPLHIIGFEPVLEPSTEKYWHHFILNGKADANDFECAGDNFWEVMYAWTPGVMPVALPDEVGAGLGPGDYQAFLIDLHYNNPDLDEGVVDRGGMRFYYTAKRRPNTFGFFVTGDPNTSGSGTPIGDGIVQHTFDCPASCSWLTLSQPVTVARTFLHMHQHGRAAKIEVIRNGKVRSEGRAEYFNFEQQGGHEVQHEPFLVEPGDAFRVTCTYQSQGKNWGPGSDDEMCMGLLSYYPKQKFLFGLVPWVCGPGFDPVFLFHCQGTHSSVTTLNSIQEVDRIFGTENEQCPELALGALPEEPPVSFFGCRGIDESPTFIGMQYWMHHDAPLFSSTCGETRVRFIFIWFMKLLGYECGRCPGSVA